MRGREGGQLAISSRRDIATTRLRTPAASRYTATDLELPSLRLMLETSLGHCCICESLERPDLDITDPVLFLDFVASHTYCVPEDPASLFIDRLAGKWPIKNFSPARARSAATCRGRPALELDARRNFSNFQPCPISRQIEALPLNRQGSQTFSAPLTCRCVTIDWGHKRFLHFSEQWHSVRKPDRAWSWEHVRAKSLLRRNDLQEEREKQKKEQGEPQRSHGMPRKPQCSYGTEMGLS